MKQTALQAGSAGDRIRRGWWPATCFGMVLAVLLVVLSLANGTPFWLARIGVIAPEAYQQDRQAFCPVAGPPAGLVSACPALRPLPGPSGRFERLSLQRLHALPPGLKTFKTARLVLLVGLPLIVLVAMLLGRCPWPRWPALLPALPLVASLSFRFTSSLLLSPSVAMVQALRSLTWLPCLLLPGPASSPAVLARLAQATAALQVLQLPLMAVEAIRGLPMSFGPRADQLAQSSLGLPSRLVGSFIQPNSLGVAVVVLLAFSISYLPQRRLLPGLALLGLPPLLLARSATGLLSWVVVILYCRCSSRRFPPILKPVALLLLAVLVGALPLVLGRLDLWQSLQGRITVLSDLLTGSHPLQLLFGQGLLTSNPTDSLPALLLLQGGVLALLGFYGLLAWAWRCDHRSRPFLLAVLLSSLTLTITELFPVNLLLGLSLHHSLCGVGGDQHQTCR